MTWQSKFREFAYRFRTRRRINKDVCQANINLSIPWKQDNRVWSNHGIIDTNETFLGYLPTPRIFRPTDPYQVSFAIKEAESSGKTIRALGSGWSFSDAVLPQSSPLLPEGKATNTAALTLTEAAMLKADTYDEAPLRMTALLFMDHFGYAIDTTSLDRSLQTLLPQILATGQDYKQLFFVEAGMTIYDLNILLDSDPNDKARRALNTMGGACGQTIVGAISTGTHGGDWDRPPLADSVRAIYLIGKKGLHHWIEPASKRITDREKILATFPCITPENIHYADDYFYATLVSMGAMGVIYAVILEVVPQYSLLQFNKWTNWKDFEKQVKADPDTVFDGEYSGLKTYLEQRFSPAQRSPNRFLQVVVNPIKDRFNKHSCFVTHRAEFHPPLPPSGVRPLSYNEVVGRSDWLADVIQDRTNLTFWDRVRFGVAAYIHHDFDANDDYQKVRKLLDYCKQNNKPEVPRALVDLVMQQSFPSSGEWTSVWDFMGGDWDVTPVVAVNPTGGLSVFIINRDNVYADTTKSGRAAHGLRTLS